MNTVAEFRKRKIPLDNIVQDWSYWKEAAWGSQEFDLARFPTPDSMINVLHKKYHTHFMISVWPKFYEGISTYNDLMKKAGYMEETLRTGSATGLAKDMSLLFMMRLMQMHEKDSGI